MNRADAIEILKGHIASYQQQCTDKGWDMLVSQGIARNNFREKIELRKHAEEQIKAFEMAVEALEHEESDGTCCFLGSPCPYQHM